MYSANCTVSPASAYVCMSTHIGSSKRMLTWLAGEGHEEMWTELFDFVYVGLDLDDGVRGGHVGCDEDIALSCKRKGDFHCDRSGKGLKIESDGTKWWWKMK